MFVSTDDPEICTVASNAGAEIVRRPSEIAGDYSSSESALLHVLDTLQSSEMYMPEEFAFLQCTSALTTGEDIDGTINALRHSNADCAMTVAPFWHFLWRRNGGDSASAINHNPAERLMRQQRDPEFLETGGVYVMRTTLFRARQHRFCGRVAMYEVERSHALEIDDPFDLELAGILAERTNEQQRASLLPSDPSGLALDFDGVLTDNRVLVSESGTEAVYCTRADGEGLNLLRAILPSIVVLSSEVNPVVEQRCRKLKLECHQGLGDKRTALLAWSRRDGIDLQHAIYVGNDVNDACCLQSVGCPVVVADAHPDVRRLARLVLKTQGGRGVLRELADLLIRTKGMDAL